MGLTRDQIAAAVEEGGPAKSEVFLPELGGTVWVRELTGTLRSQFEVAVASGDAQALERVTLNMVAACTLDDKGERLLDTNLVRRMWRSKAKAVFRLRDAIIGVSAMDDSDLEALSENFGEAPSDDSSSDSPDISDSQ